VSDESVTRKPWVQPKIIDVGSVEAHTTAGTGNVGDQSTGQHHYRALSIDVPKDGKAILPEGE
jgi:hypothetical protein